MSLTWHEAERRHMVKLTRRQWLELPLNQKTRVGAAPAVFVAPDQPVPVQWVARLEDSDLK
jgi:hypothetical protein